MTSSSLPAGQIASLDGLRAVSILLVFLSHVGLGPIVPGGLGVTIFFFISGYLITALMLREWQETGQLAWALSGCAGCCAWALRWPWPLRSQSA